MPAPQKLPNPFNWRYVLVHRNIRHGSSILEPGYDENARSFLSLHHGEVKPTICIKGRALFDRLMRLGGWEDITKEVEPSVKLWDEEKERWKLDVEGLLPWERVPGKKVAPIPVEAPSDDEAPLDEPKQRKAPEAKPSPQPDSEPKPNPEPPPEQTEKPKAKAPKLPSVRPK